MLHSKREIREAARAILDEHERERRFVAELLAGRSITYDELLDALDSQWKTLGSWTSKKPEDLIERLIEEDDLEETAHDVWRIRVPDAPPLDRGGEDDARVRRALAGLTRPRQVVGAAMYAWAVRDGYDSLPRIDWPAVVEIFEGMGGTVQLDDDGRRVFVVEGERVSEKRLAVVRARVDDLLRGDAPRT